MNNTYLLLLLILSSILGATGAVLFKYSANRKDMILKIFEKYKFSRKIFLLNKYVIIGIIFYVSAALLFVSLLKYAELNILYPTTSLNYMLSALVGFWFFKEKATKYKIIGIILIIVGVCVVFL